MGSNDSFAIIHLPGYPINKAFLSHATAFEIAKLFSCPRQFLLPLFLFRQACALAATVTKYYAVGKAMLKGNAQQQRRFS
jgi:hypothetical protein